MAFTRLFVAASTALVVSLPCYGQSPEKRNPHRTGAVRIDHRSLVDDGGPFSGLGVSYFTALWRCKYDRPRLETDLDFLSGCGFNYFRMLSMVGHHAAWDGLEIAPVSFTDREGDKTEQWPDYWQQCRELVDLAYDRYGMRTQITIFADAQIMPKKNDRIEHMRRMLSEVVRGREDKIILLEVANEAWQNGFPGEQGVRDLREFARYLSDRTEVLVAISSNHEWSGEDGMDAFDRLYGRSAADVATWHFSRDRRTDEGWQPVYDCWELAGRAGAPPISSNEPIGPGASVNSERDPIRLVMAACFAHTAGATMYVFHSEAGVFGRTRFEDTPGVQAFAHSLRLLPGDVASWRRNDGQEPDAPFTPFLGEAPNRYWSEGDSATAGCVRNAGARRDDDFVCVPIGIRANGLKLRARGELSFTAFDPLTGKPLLTAAMEAGEHIVLPQGAGALIIVGRFGPAAGPSSPPPDPDVP